MSKAAELANLIGNINAGGGGANKNVIINGAMNVAQRGTSTTGLGANGANYSTVDRFYTYANGTAGRFTMTQDSSAPDGFANSLKLDCTTADTSIAAAEQLVLAQVIEGQNLQHLNKGTSSALPVAVSFYVKGNASATYMCALIDNDNSRMSTKQFSVTTDWTRITINVPADTTGALDDDNAGSFNLNFYLHAGSNLTGGTYTASTWGASTDANRAVGISSFFDSTDRTFFITGVQLEVGQNPTEFEHEPYDRTLAKCQRYYEKGNFITNKYANDVGSGYCKGSSWIAYKQEKRAAATGALSGESSLGTSSYTDSIEFQTWFVNSGNAFNTFDFTWTADAEL